MLLEQLLPLRGFTCRPRLPGSPTSVISLDLWKLTSLISNNLRVTSLYFLQRSSMSWSLVLAGYQGWGGVSDASAIRSLISWARRMHPLSAACDFSPQAFWSNREHKCSEVRPPRRQVTACHVLMTQTPHVQRGEYLARSALIR